MRSKRWIGWALVLACLVLGACGGRERRVPLTTSSEEARKLYNQGNEALDMYRLDEARSYFAQAVEKDPDFAMAHLALAETAMTPEARGESLKTAVKHVDAVSRGERLVILGVDAGEKMDGRAQMDHLSQAAQLYPDDARLQVRLGDFYLARVNYPDAIRSYQDALELEPDFSLAHQRIGRLYQSVGRYDHAEEAFNLYVENNPSEPRALELLAELLMKSGRLEESTATYEKVLSLDPEIQSARIGIGNNLLFQDKYEEALELFRKLYDEADDDAQRRTALTWVAAAHVHAGASERAVEELEAADALAEKSGDVEARAALLELMGNVLLEAGDLDRAMARFTEAKTVIDKADVSSRRRDRARRDFLYYDARVTIARQDHPNLWEKVSKLRLTARTSWVAGVEDRVNELGGRIALDQGNYEMATTKLLHADQSDPRVVYLTAVVYARSDKKGQARRACTAALNFNEPRFEVAFVREKARKLLAEL